MKWMAPFPKTLDESSELSRRRYKRLLRQIALLGVALVGFSLLLAWRTEAQQDAIRAAAHRQAVFVHDSCVTRNTNIGRLNTLYAGLAEIERGNPFVATSPETIQRRIQLYTAAQLILIDCGPKP